VVGCVCSVQEASRCLPCRPELQTNYYANIGESDHNNYSYTCCRNTLHKCILNFTALCNVIVKLCLLVQSTVPHVLATWNRGANCSHKVCPRTLRTLKDADYVIKGGLVLNLDLRVLLCNLLININWKLNTTIVKLKWCTKLIQQFNSSVNIRLINCRTSQIPLIFVPLLRCHHISKRTFTPKWTSPSHLCLLTSISRFIYWFLIPQK
jgi:hypothetical protein